MAVGSKVDKDWNKVEFSETRERPYYYSFYSYYFPLSILNSLKEIILEADEWNYHGLWRSTALGLVTGATQPKWLRAHRAS